jgi:rare lipoprotein A
MAKNTQLYRIICIIYAGLCTLLLSNCSHIHKKDGPPHFYVDESKIPNAIPKHEKLSKYGNMRSYRVFGKRYYVMKSSRYYEATGIASWYGTQFHAQRTSSGERYNMLAMTAAHKTLPLPTYVEVTNLKNQRKIIVKINDRGPFKSNRLIDLSYVAAKKLGMLAHGTTTVKIRAINPDYYPNYHRIKFHFPWILTKNNKPMPKYTFLGSRHPHRLIFLRAGTFHSRLHAKNLQKRLSTLLNNTAIRIMSSSNKKSYRVEVGPFHDTTTANRVINQLHTFGIQTNKAYG